MAEQDINAQVRNLLGPKIAQMRERGVSKEDAVKLSGQPYEVVDRIYNPTKTEHKDQGRQLKDKRDKGE